MTDKTAQQIALEALEKWDKTDGASLLSEVRLAAALREISALPEQDAPESRPGLYQQRIRLPEPLTEVPESGVVYAPWITARGNPLYVEHRGASAQKMVDANLAYATPKDATERARAWLMVEREDERPEADEKAQATGILEQALADCIPAVRPDDGGWACCMEACCLPGMTHGVRRALAALRGEGDE